MILEAHVIQNVAPANLNRDDTGAPKDAVFGGYRRARVSSQAWKRAVRQSFATEFGEDELAWRTKRLVDQVAEKLTASGRNLEQARKVAVAVLVAGGAGIDKKTGYTKVLWLVARKSIDALVKLCEAHWDALEGILGVLDELSADDAANAKKYVGAVKEVLGEDYRVVQQVIVKDVVGKRAVDIALFGRMLTDVPDGGTVDAAVQVAHAISTHSVDTEFDYFTAVDDLLPNEESGAGMLGTVEFNSACFYRYACLDTAQLVGNLDGDGALARRAALAFVTAFVTVMPTGKQNTFAAHNPPAAALLVARKSGSWNLANAFADPVRATRNADLVAASCERLAGHWAELVAMYGNPATALGLASLPSLIGKFAPLDEAQQAPLGEVAEALVDAVLPAQS